MSSKLYIGNLPAEVNEASLRQLLQDHNLVVNSVLIKRGGYAFIDCPEQSIIDQAIEKLNGYSFMGSTLVVEPSVAGGGRRSLNARTVIISNVPLHVRVEDLERLLTPVGVVQKCDKASAKRDPQPTPGTQTIEVVYETAEQAEAAVTQLNSTEFEGNILKVESVMERRGGSGGGGGGGGGSSSVAGRGARGGARGGAPGQSLPFTGVPAGPQRQPDFPLRILVLSEMVGAIIGRQGGTIRQITQQTRARVDVHRKDNVGSLEKAITIYGNPENCTNACRKILEVMQQEADNTNKGEVSLKLLAHNNLIGRIIGKGGNTIKKIMQDTDTKITVSSADVEPTAFSMGDVSSFNMERVITIKGSIENMSRAEAMISAKLRQSYENDLQAMAPQSMMFPGLHPMAMMSTVGMGFPRSGPPVPNMYGPPAAPYQPMYPPGAPMPTGTQQETSYLYIPNNAVGAIIGSKGSHIRNIIRFSGASVKIAALPEGAAEPQQERKVTIVGTPEAQWKAQYLIFEKMREEGFMSPGEEVRLTVELLVPSSQVGRIIGKGGQNVRELQRSTSCIIKLPEHGASAGEETTVHIIGAFYASQSAQRRIRAMISQQAATGGPTPPSGRLRALSGSGSASGSASGPAAGAPGANNRSRDRDQQQ